MDAPPPGEDSRPFVRIAALMSKPACTFPTVLASDLTQGFLLLSDLGETRRIWLHSTTDNAIELFEAAIDTLIRWQSAAAEMGFCRCTTNRC